MPDPAEGVCSLCYPHPIAILPPSHRSPASPQLWCWLWGSKSRDVGPSGAARPQEGECRNV